MRKFTKPLLIVLAMILVCVTSVFATIAYLTSDTGVANNTFTVGKVEINLDETMVDEDGNAVSGADRVLENEYKLMPGHTYIKDPTVTIKADSEASYVRMFVEIKDIEDVKDVIGAAYPESVVDDKFLPQYLVSGWDPSVWVSTKLIDEDSISGSAIYEFRYHTTVSTEDKAELVLDALFDSFTIPTGIANDDLLKLDELEINVYAQAIQADGFGSADAAFENLPAAKAAFEALGA